ncbi:MAG: hypothetical protein IT378_06265 [Sandaracinaceae bacterium]|nr:hypothetical protein [Sandaracinaceae bacterium]
MAPRPAYDALCRAERSLALGSETGAVVACAVMAEAILHHVLASTLSSVRDRARAEAIDKGGKDLGLGMLLGWTRKAEQLAGQSVLADPERAALNELNRNRNALVHAVHARGGGSASTDLAAQRALVRGVLVPLAQRLGALDAAETAHARREARRPERAARVELELDRTPHKAALRDGLAERAETPLLIVLLDGEKRQGHGALAEVVRLELDKHVRADWTVIGGSDGVIWPRLPHLGSRLAKLLELLGRALELETPAPRADPLADPRAWAEHEAGLCEAILRLQDLHDGIVLRHRLRPQPGDDVVMRAYLERVWLPAARLTAERVAHPALAVSLETERARPGLWLAPAWWEAWRERRSARRLSARAPRGGVASTIVVPELGRVPRAELERYLERRGLDRERAAQQSKLLIRATEGGCFDDLVCEIERWMDHPLWSQERA